MTHILYIRLLIENINTRAQRLSVSLFRKYICSFPHLFMNMCNSFIRLGIMLLRGIVAQRARRCLMGTIELGGIKLIYLTTARVLIYRNMFNIYLVKGCPSNCEP
jgi:hypothetical protein